MFLFHLSLKFQTDRIASLLSLGKQLLCNIKKKMNEMNKNNGVSARILLVSSKKWLKKLRLGSISSTVTDYMHMFSFIWSVSKKKFWKKLFYNNISHYKFGFIELTLSRTIRANLKKVIWINQSKRICHSQHIFSLLFNPELAHMTWDLSPKVIHKCLASKNETFLNIKLFVSR